MIQCNGKCRCRVSVGHRCMSDTETSLIRVMFVFHRLILNYVLDIRYVIYAQIYISETFGFQQKIGEHEQYLVSIFQVQ
jgi:hypothetical protein